MSRKTIGYVVAIMTTVLAVFQEQFGLSLNPTALAAGVGAVLTYVFFEAKLDLAALKTQPGKWKDPKFLLTVISVVLASIEAQFHLGIPVEAIVSVLTVAVGILFKMKFSADNPY